MLISGGVIGVFCHHNYAHAANSPHIRLPSMLKGADAAMLAVCTAFGLETQTRPVYLTTEEGEVWTSRWGQVNEYPPGKVTDESTARLLNKLKHNPLELFDVKSNAQIDVKPGKIEWVGNDFEPCQVEECLGDYEDWMPKHLAEADFLTGYGGIHWLNKMRHKAGNRACLIVFSPWLLRNDYCSMAMNPRLR